MAPTAIVGISARLPGGALSASDLNHDTFFEFLLRGGESYERIPADRFDIDSFQGTSLGHVLPEKGSFLKGVDQFDHVDFGVTAKDAKLMAVSTRILLEQSFLALLDAGIEYRGENVGCYMAGVSHDLFMLAGQDEMEAQGSFACGPAMIANRVSYHLDLRGPSIPIDTACSSSLTATHLAMQAIENGECQTALVGGCQLNLRVIDWFNYSRGGVLSKDGKCKPFDAQADGFSRGEGAVVIVLKRLDAALKDGDKIYATVLGTAINSSGSAVPVNAPHGPAQEAAMHEAFRRAQRQPSDVDFVELHATGTSRGDPTEANWVVDAFARSGELVVGSVKGNIGHLEITAFLASLSKWDRHRMRVPLTVESLSSRSGSGKYLVSLTSSGIGGANGHCVVESGPDAPSTRSPFWREDPPAQLLIAGALSPRALPGVQENIGRDAISYPLGDVALTYNRRARSLTWRSFAVTKDQVPPKFTAPRLSSTLPPQFVFVFSGQGPQHLLMGKELFDQCIPFRNTVLELDELYSEITGESLRLDHGLFGGSGSKALGDIWPIAVTLPALTVFQLALFDTLVSIGVKPDALVGHSAGEVAVLYASGAGSKALALEVSIARGKAMSRLEQHAGTMAAVNCSAVDAERLLATVIDELGPGALEIACYNADDAVTLSGSEAHVDAAVSKAKSAGMFAQRLRTRVPVHSSMMELCRDEYCSSLRRVFARYSLSPCTIPVYSSATGLPLDSMLDAEYFWMNSRGPVRFTAAIRSATQGVAQPAFVEIGPHPVLNGYIRALTGDAALATCPARRPTRKGVSVTEAELFLSSIGELCALGRLGVDFRAIAGAKAEPLPVAADYPFSRKVIPSGHLSGESVRFSKRRRGPLNYDGMRINQETHPSLSDHVIKGEAIMPAAGYLEMALEYGARVLWNVEFLSIIPLGRVKPILAAIDLEGNRWVVRSASKTTSDVWPPKLDKVHASGHLALSIPGSARPACVDLSAIALQFYSIMNRFGYGYGPQYRRVEAVSVCRTDAGDISEALVRIRGYVGDLEHDPNFVLHPAILDAAIHTIAHPFLSGIGDPALYALPSKVRSLVTHEALYDSARPETIFSHVIAREWTPYTAVWDCVIYDSQGRALCTIDGLEVAKHGHSLTAPVERHFELTCAPRNIDIGTVLQGDTGGQTDYVFSTVDSATSSDFVVAFRRGSELQLQGDVARLDELDDVTIWLTAPAGEHGDALFGFARAFRREVPNWRVFSITHAAPLSLGNLCAVARRLKPAAGNELDFLLDEDGRVHHPKLEEHHAATRTVPFDRTRPWRVQDGAIHHFDIAPLQGQEVIIDVEALSPGPGPLRGFVGRRRSDLELVVGVAANPPTNVIRCSSLSITPLPDDFKMSYRRLPVISTVVCALVFGRRLVRQREELSKLSIMVVPSDSDVGAGIVHILSGLGISVIGIPTTTFEYDVVMRHHSSIDVALCGEANPALLSAASSSVAPNGTSFSWDTAVAAVLEGKPWLIGEALESLLPALLGNEMGHNVLFEPTTMLPAADRADQDLFDATRTYLLVGGIGSLGLHFANWMYEHGARNIVLTSRSGKASITARKDVAAVRLLTYLESRPDLTLQLRKANAADESDMRRVIEHAPSPLAGCMLLSGLLVDGAFRLHTASSYDAPFQSKVDAFRVLHRIIPIASLDWLVATSSVTALFGNAGQTNYASANSMLHGLLRPYRNACALVVPFITDSSVASAQNAGRMKQLSDWGFTSRELCVTLGDCILGLRNRPIEVYVPDFNWELISKYLGRTSLFAHLLNESEAEGTEPDASDTLEARIMSILDIAAEDFSGDVPLTGYGLDSLSAARLAHALKPTLLVTQMQLLAGVSSNDLRRRLESEAQGSGDDVGKEAAAKIAETVPGNGPSPDATAAMLATLRTYSAGIHRRLATPTSDDGEGSRLKCVLLTGTTGSLGCALLATLANVPGVTRVYAVNRPKSDESLLQRQMTAFERHGFEVSDACLAKIVFLEASLQNTGLGIADATLAELGSAVTTIIHNAWPVNFNVPLAAFDDSLAATRNLVNLALQSKRRCPPRLIFISTFSTLLSDGYTESKWIAERLLESAASENADFQPVTIRVGAICGAPRGVWDRSHWVPSIISAGGAMGYLPIVDKDVSWIPLDAAAKAIADVACYTATAPSVLHLVHPKPVLWSDIFGAVSAKTGAQLIPYGEWVARLENVLLDGSTNGSSDVSHALRLLDFFRDRLEKVKTAPKDRLLGDAYDGLLFPRVDMAQMLRVSPSLREVRPLDASDVETWLDAWSMGA
ncbi:ketoacyl-synt-domain-containing protein [Auricularia subglabra TFB-10046 SS5]|nr:ketoacyl-synt-domain-containing protein [Auricularia subglabra TFB-10046 SS5]